MSLGAANAPLFILFSLFLYDFLFYAATKKNLVIAIRLESVSTTIIY